MSTLERVLVGCAFVGLVIAGDRWLHWKFDYGARAERQIATLERRITALERGHVMENGVEMCRRKDCPICRR